MPLRVVIDAIPITGASTAIVTEHLLAAWADLDVDDEIHVLIGPEATFDISPKLRVHRVSYGRLPLFSRLWAQSVTLPRLCQQVNADIVLGLIASTTFTRLPCPRTILVHDLRHELRPEQFGGKTLLAKRVSYQMGYRQARAIACISERTKVDLLARHPFLERTLVRVVHHGADHTAGWAASDSASEPTYAVAFGQYLNKNVNLVLEAWAELVARGQALPLRIFGLPDGDRDSVQDDIGRLGLDQLVTALPWLPADEYQAQFAAASLVVFPSDFEGFGLPAVEAMALGIPLVISPDAALQEVAGGFAVTVDAEVPAALADAVVAAQAVPAATLDAARAHAAEFTWARSARGMHDMLAEAVSYQPSVAAPTKSPDRLSNR